MYLCDSNVWLALALEKHVHHAAAREWLSKKTAPSSVFFCRATERSFLRLLTNVSVLRAYGNPPLTNREARRAYKGLLRDDRIGLRREEPEALEAHWSRFARRDTASPKLWMDAYLAAFALAGGFRMVTTDNAFKQFKGLDLQLIGNVQ